MIPNPSWRWSDELVESDESPSAFLPVAMSFVALATVLGHVAVSASPEKLISSHPFMSFNCSMISQLPIMMFFAIKSLRQNPRQTLFVMALQLAAAVAALAPVFALNL